MRNAPRLRQLPVRACDGAGGAQPPRRMLQRAAGRLRHGGCPYRAAGRALLPRRPSRPPRHPRRPEAAQRDPARRAGLDPLRCERSSVACLSLHVSNGAHAAIARTDGRLCAHWCPRWRQDLHGLLPARARARSLRCAAGVSAARLHVLRRLELWGDGVCNRSVCVSREHA